MNAFRPLSTVEQLAAYLRDEILRGGLGEKMPGVNRLARMLGVSPKTAMAAVRQLEREGVLQGQGPRRRSLTVIPENMAMPALRVFILPYEETDRTLNYVVDLQYQLMEAGHTAGFAPKNMVDLGNDAKRVARLVKETKADAWVVLAGSRQVLEWFADQSVPAFAFFGRRRSVRIAGVGPDKLPATLAAVRRLVALGHRKIVMLLREEQRKPQPGPVARSFLEELEKHGISTSPYNLPDWDDSGDGLRRCLDSLFRITPPSAVILDEVFIFNLTQHHLARRGFLTPEHVSLVCSDPDPTFAWAYPSVAHISWDPRHVVRRIVRWADHVARGKADLRQTLTPAKFVPGGTVGPAPGKDGIGIQDK